MHINQLKPHLGRLPVAWQDYVEHRAEAEMLVEEADCPEVGSVPSMAPKSIASQAVPVPDVSSSEKTEASDADSVD